MEIVIPKAGLPQRECLTQELKIHGYKEVVDFTAPFYFYGSDEENIQSLIINNKALAEPIHPALPYNKAQIVWSVQNEMCMTVEDALSRRTRALLLDANAAREAAALVGKLMAVEMKKDDSWIDQQVNTFSLLAKNYLPVQTSKII